MAKCLNVKFMTPLISGLQRVPPSNPQGGEKVSTYLEFKEDEIGTITVISKKQKAPLGEIAFYVPWKQYVFLPISNTIFNDECLQDIIQFIQGKNRAEF